MNDKNATQNKFYLACRNGDLPTVKALLRIIQYSDLLRLEPNGSTGLHAAAFFGHFDIVKCILEQDDGSRRLWAIRNQPFGLTPADEAKTDEIRRLFGTDSASTGRSRFFDDHSGEQVLFSPINLTTASDSTNEACNQVQWMDEYANAHRISQENHEYMRRWVIKIPLQHLLGRIRSEYAECIAKLDQTNQQTNDMLQAAIEEEDPRYLLYAYTQATPFFSQLNRALVQKGSDFRFFASLTTTGFHGDNVPPMGLWQYLYTAVLINHSLLNDYYYTGVCYRGMNLNLNDLNQYVPGARILTRSFLSSSKSISAASFFLVFDQPAVRPVLLVYQITQKRTALAAHHFSVFPIEEEILITPFRAFSVEHVTINSFEGESRGHATQIFLQEIEPNRWMTPLNFGTEISLASALTLTGEIQQIKDNLAFVIDWGNRSPTSSNQLRQMCKPLLDIRRILEMEILSEKITVVHELHQVTKRLKAYLCAESVRTNEYTLTELFEEVTQSLAHLKEICFSEQTPMQNVITNTSVDTQSTDITDMYGFDLYMSGLIALHSYVRIDPSLFDGRFHNQKSYYATHSHTVPLRAPFTNFVADRTLAIERTVAKQLLGGTVNDPFDEHELYRHVAASHTRELIEEQSSGRIKASFILQENHSLVILGDPGCGKTSFLRWLAQLSAQSWLKRDNDKERRLLNPLDNSVLGPLRIPILVRVGEVVTQLTENPSYSLLDCIGRPTWFGKLAVVNDAQLVAVLIRRAIEQGQALIMFDGLDEIPNAQQRKTVVSLVRNFIHDYVFTQQLKTGTNQVIVSSRIVGYFVEPLVDDRIIHYKVAPLSSDAIDEFIDHWLSSVSLPTLDQHKQVTELKNLLSSSKVLRELASNSLLLSVLCTLVIISCNPSESIAVVYKNRVSLYNALLECMFRAWQLRGTKLNMNQVSQVLSNIAVHMHRHSPTGLIEQFDLEALYRQFQSQTQSVSVDPGQFVRTISDDVGLFVPRGLCVYGFLHLVFQEYFTCLYIVRTNDEESVSSVVQRLIYLSTDPRFYEPLVLALGWISKNWSSDNFNLLCQQLITEGHKLHMPVGALMLMSAIPDLSQLPSTCTLFAALDQFLTLSTQHNWLSRFPFFVNQLNLALNNLPSSKTSDWIQHIFETAESHIVRELSRTLLEILYRAGTYMPPWFSDGLIAEIQRVIPIEFMRNDYFPDMLLLLASHHIPHILPAPSGGLRELFLTIRINYIEPRLLSVIISLYGGLHRQIDAESDDIYVAFSPFHMQGESTLSSIIVQLFRDHGDDQVTIGNQLLSYCISVVGKIDKNENSHAVVDTFVAWMCLEGITNSCLTNSFTSYKAFDLARSRLVHTALNIREAFYVEDIRVPCSLKNKASLLIDQVVSSGVNDGLFNFVESVSFALSRLTCTEGSLYVQNTSIKERLLNLRLPSSIVTGESVVQYITTHGTTAVLMYIRTTCSPLRHWLGYDLDREEDDDELEQVSNGKHMMLKWSFYSPAYRLAIAVAFFPRHHQTIWLRIIDKWLSHESEQFIVITMMLVELLLCNVIEPNSNSLRYAILLFVLRPEWDKYHLNSCVRAIVSAEANMKIRYAYENVCTASQPKEEIGENKNHSSTDEEEKNDDYNQETDDDYDQEECDRWLNQCLSEERQQLKIYMSSSNSINASDKNIKIYLCCVTIIPIVSSLQNSSLTAKQELITEIIDAITHISNMSLRLHAYILVSTLFHVVMTRDQNARLRHHIIENMSNEKIDLELYVILLLQLFSNDYAAASWTEVLIVRLFDDLNQTQDEYQQTAICEALMSIRLSTPTIRRCVLRFIQQASWRFSPAVSNVLHLHSTIFRDYFHWAETVDTSTLLSCMYLMEMAADIDEAMKYVESFEIKNQDDVMLCITTLEKCSPDNYGTKILSNSAVALITNLLHRWSISSVPPNQVDVENIDRALRSCQNSLFCNRELIHSWLNYMDHPYLNLFARHAALLLTNSDGEAELVTIKICASMLSDSNDYFRTAVHHSLIVSSLSSSKLGQVGLYELIQIWLDMQETTTVIQQESFRHLRINIDCSEHFQILADLDRERFRYRESKVTDDYILNLGHSAIKFNRKNSRISFLKLPFRCEFRELISHWLKEVANLCLKHEDASSLQEWQEKYGAYCLSSMVSECTSTISSFDPSISHCLRRILRLEKNKDDECIFSPFIEQTAVTALGERHSLEEARYILETVICRASVDNDEEKEPSLHRYTPSVVASAIRSYALGSKDSVKEDHVMVTIFQKLMTTNMSPDVRDAAALGMASLLSPDHYNGDSRLCCGYVLNYINASHRITIEEFFRPAIPNWKKQEAVAQFLITNASSYLEFFVENLCLRLVDAASDPIDEFPCMMKSTRVLIALALHIYQIIPAAFRLAVRTSSIGEDMFQHLLCKVAVKETVSETRVLYYRFLSLFQTCLTSELATIFFFACWESPNVDSDVYSCVSHVETVINRDVVEQYLFMHLNEDPSLQRRYMAARLLIRLARQGELSIIEVQEKLISAIHDPLSRYYVRAPRNYGRDSIGEDEDTFERVLTDLLMRLTFLIPTEEEKPQQRTGDKLFRDKLRLTMDDLIQQAWYASFQIDWCKL